MLDNDASLLVASWSAPEPERSIAELGDEAVRHNWLIDEQIRADKRRLKRISELLHVSVPGDDVEKKLIQDRLMELKHMTKPRYDERAVLLRYTPEQRELILASTLCVTVIKKGLRHYLTQKVIDIINYSYALGTLTTGEYFKHTQAHTHTRIHTHTHTHIYARTHAHIHT